jgi:predicted NAD/FAD-binding protein
MKRKKLAIIGAGGAGSVAAWALHKLHDIKLFESEKVIGGHAYTYKLNIENEVIPIDLGVEYFSEKQSPNLFALLNHFNIETYVAPLSFTYGNNETKEFWNNYDLSGSLNKTLKDEFSKFHIQMHEVLHLYSSDIKQMTIGEFLRKEGYSDEFIYKGLTPILTTFSSCHSPILDYSLTFCAISFSMGLLSFFQPTYWRKVKNGIASYLEIISAKLKHNIINKRVIKVLRNRNQVTICTDDGTSEIFDEVIFATHADIALSLLDSPSPLELEILKNFEYTPVTSILHSDTSILLKEQSFRGYCEFKSTTAESEKVLYGSLTRNINALPNYYNMKTPILVTFDPIHEIQPSLTYGKKSWKIPKLRPSDMKNKRNISKIQGKNYTWFCGTDTSFTGHEGAILSGLVIAEMHGALYPFRNNNWAKVHFDIAKGLMGLYTPLEKTNQKIANKIYTISKWLGLHKSQISRALLDLYA